MTTYNVAGLDDTGGTDVTADLMAFIATVPDGSDGAPNTILFGADKTYRIDLLFLTTGRSWLTFDGNGSTFMTDVSAPHDPLAPGNPNRTRTHWRMTLCTGIHLTNFTIQGPNVNAGLADNAYVAIYEAQHGIELASCDHVTVDHVTITKVHGDWMYFGVVIGQQLSNNILIEDCHFIDNGRQGFSFVGCQHIEMRHNTTLNCRRSLMDFEPNNAQQPAFDIDIHHNTFGAHRLSFVASKGVTGEVSNITIDSNTCATVCAPVVVAPPSPNTRHNWTLTNNVSLGTNGYGGGTAPSGAWVFIDVDGVTCTGNTVPLQPNRGMHLCELVDCSDYTITGNTIPGGVGQFFTHETPDPEPDPVPDSDPVALYAVGSGRRIRLSDASKLALA